MRKREPVTGKGGPIWEKHGQPRSDETRHKSPTSSKKHAKKLKASTPSPVRQPRFSPHGFSSRAPPPKTSGPDTSAHSIPSLFRLRPFDSLSEQPNPDNKARTKEPRRHSPAMLYKVVHPDSDNLVSARGCRPNPGVIRDCINITTRPGVRIYTSFILLARSSQALSSRRRFMRSSEPQRPADCEPSTTARPRGGEGTGAERLGVTRDRDKSEVMFEDSFSMFKNNIFLGRSALMPGIRVVFGHCKSELAWLRSE